MEQLQTKVTAWTDAIAAQAADPLVWTQLGLIAAVFVIARWVLRPGMDRGLDRLAQRALKISSLSRALLALRKVSAILAWLLLQWIAIGIADAVGWPNRALVIVASLLTAWLLIRLVTMLVASRIVARVIAIVAWSVAALNILGWLHPTVEMLDSWAVQVGGLRVSPLTVINGVLALWFSLWLASVIASAIERQLQRAEDVSPSMLVLGGKLARIVLLTVAVLVAMTTVGIDLTALAVFSGALGVGLGFGLQKIFSNLVSGVILLMDRSIKPGDVISVGSTFGWINYLGARYASVITRDGIEHLIPNEELITQRVENWSYSNKLVRLRIPIGISYKCDPRIAIKLCVEAALAVERVKRDPDPRCQLVAFGDSSVDLELRVWIDDPSNGRANVISEVLLGVWDRFHEHGIEIPFPQHDVHLQTAFGTTDMETLRQCLAGRAEPPA